MHVDDPLGIGADKLRREHLHVARENDEVNLIFGEQGALLFFDLRFCAFRDRHGARGDRHKVKRNPVELSQRAGFFVVADDEREPAVQFSRLIAVKKIG